ncbi:MAG: putative Ig domain-containing protein, partial [Pseudomonadota bacterium]
GNTGDNVLSGLAGNDALTGNAGNDTLDGGLDADTMAGGAGNDTYIVDNAGDVVTENANEGADTVQSSVIYTLTNNVENLTLTGTDNINGTGNTLNNVIVGNSGANVIDGGAGNDTLTGGSGDDTYVFNLGDGVDTIDDLTLAGEGNALQFGTGIDPTALTLSFDGGVLVLNMSGGDQLRLTNFDPNDVYGAHAVETFSFADGTVLTYSQLIDRGFDLVGTAGDDVITGTNGVDRIVGGDGNDVINGGGGNDIIDGGLGNDILIGGAGDDTYSYALGDGTDTISDTAGTDALALSGVTLPDLNTSVSGNDLVLELPDGNTITIQNWLLDTGHQIETITLDGTNYAGSFIEAWGHAPIVAAPMLDIATDEDSPFNLDIGTYFTDADLSRGDVLTYRTALGDGSDLPSWLSFDAATGAFSGIPLQADVGSLDIQVTATDSVGRTASEVFTLTVNNVNDVPVVANSIVDQTTDEDSPFSFTLPAETFADEDSVVGDTLALTVSLADGSVLPTWLSFDAATGTFSGAPNNGDVGSYEIRVTATDVAGTSADDVFTLTVNNTNDTPIVANAIADQFADEDGIYSLNLADVFADDDLIHGDSLSFSAALADGDLLPTWLSFDAATGTFTGTPANGDVRSYDIHITATDAAGTSASDVFTLTVNNVNDIPVIVTPIVDVATDEDLPFSLSVAEAFTDDDLIHGDSLTLAATLADGSALPGWLAFDADTSTFSGTPNNWTVGNYEIRVTATDTAGLSVSDVFSLAVNNINDNPILANVLNDLATDEDAPFSFTVPTNTFDDDDFIHGDSLTLSALLADGSVLPDWLVFNAAIGTFTGTPDNGDVGNYDLRITATDLAGTSVFDDFVLVVHNTNDAPILANALADQLATEGTAFRYALPGDAFRDDDAIHGDTLSYTANLADGTALPSWLTFDAATQTFTGTAPVDSNLIGTDGDDVLVDTDTGISGTWDIRVTATDTSGVGADDTFTLTLQGVPGNDTLQGGKGNDVLNGGGGNDIYI